MHPSQQNPQATIAARRHHPQRRRPRLPVPRGLHARTVRSDVVVLVWRPVHLRHRHVTYDVFRDGRRVAQRHARPQFTDHHVQPGRLYRYRVCVRVAGHEGPRSRRLVVRTPRLPQSRPVPTGGLTQAMVDRLFWRAGFGPAAIDRLEWVGKPAAALVDHFLTTPYSLAPAIQPATYRGNPIDPLASDTELQLEWLDRMVRAGNPFIERMNLFWHRHFAVSRDAGIPSAFLLTYRDRLRRYSDLAGNPHARFRDLALEMTTQDAAMSMYLTGYLNRKGKPNENYAREFMELFTLGVSDAAGRPNYSQSDVHELARAFTGYGLNQTTGVVALNPSQQDTATKTILGRSGTFDAPAAVDIVLSHPSHASFLIRKLWSEFIAVPIPAGTLAQLTFLYVSSGGQLAPVLRGILSHPLIFDSLDEPAMIKPPIVYTAGVVRALGAPLRDTWQTTALLNMQQQPYHPPNVAGWEGGLSWMTTTTSTARFDLVVRCQGLLPAAPDLPGESAAAALDRAWSSCGQPWVSPATRAVLLRYALGAPVGTAAQRRERYYALCAFILGGPDGQVM